jgi:FtsH-binding integral membrane protein
VATRPGRKPEGIGWNQFSAERKSRGTNMRMWAADVDRKTGRWLSSVLVIQIVAFTLYSIGRYPIYVDMREVMNRSMLIPLWWLCEALFLALLIGVTAYLNSRSTFRAPTSYLLFLAYFFTAGLALTDPSLIFDGITKIPAGKILVTFKLVLAILVANCAVMLLLLIKDPRKYDKRALKERRLT